MNLTKKEKNKRKRAAWNKMLKAETKQQKQERVKAKKEYDRKYRERVKNEPWFIARVKYQREKYKDLRGGWDRKYRKNNKKSISISNKNWGIKKGKAYFAAVASKRRAIKANAILPSTDFNKIKKIYIQCRKLSKETGAEYHVDHIIPLAVGGAHHQGNLRVITAEENMQKGDAYIEGLGGVWADNELARENKP